MNKAELRSEINTKLQELTKEYRAQASQFICEKLQRLFSREEAGIIACFCPSSKEPEITPFLQTLISKFTLCFPKKSSATGEYEWHQVKEISPFELVKGEWGILEPWKERPIAKAEISYCIIPGRAFDPETGHRLGHGHGNFDKLLSGISGIKIGICFDTQITKLPPSDSWDIPMDWILSENCTKNFQCL